MSIPKLSPFLLIQESLWPNQWLILVSCVLLNQTSRKQVEKIWRHFIHVCPNPEAIISIDEQELALMLKPLGFYSRQAKMLKKLASAYIKNDWKHAKDLPGIGEYGGRAWEIFCCSKLGTIEPKDGALKIYWRWSLNKQ